MATEGRSDKFKRMLWPSIDDSSSAMEAMKLGQWVGLLIGIGYGFAIVVAISTDQYPDGTAFEDEAELYGIVFMYGLVTAVAMLFWLLARRGMGWAVLVVSVWGLIESVLKLLGGSGGGVIITILLILFCTTGFRGGLGIRILVCGRPGRRLAGSFGRAPATVLPQSDESVSYIPGARDRRHGYGLRRGLCRRRQQ